MILSVFSPSKFLCFKMLRKIFNDEQYILEMSLLGWLIFFGVHDAGAAEQGEPARLLVVTVTKGFRHGSIETAEPILGKLGHKRDFFHVTSSACLQIAHPNQAPRRGKNVTDMVVADCGIQRQTTGFQKADQPWQETLKQSLPLRFRLNHSPNLMGLCLSAQPVNYQFPISEPFFTDSRGNAFIGVHAASDTLKSSDAYVEMIAVILLGIRGQPG